MPYRIDKTGHKYGRLTVIAHDESYIGKNTKWICKCECGETVSVFGYSLEGGHTKSCGCLKSEKLIERSTIHGDAHRGTRPQLYSTYHNMISRCTKIYREDHRFYENVKVCDEWLNSYLVFKEWALSHGYQEGLTLDRIDVYGDYCPENCRWTTWEVQHNNTRTNKMIEYNGEVKSLAMWCKELHLPYNTIRSRLNKLHWDIKTSFETPIKTRGS